MAQPVIQTSFHAGEWAPELNARVDLAKYHAAAALLRNYFVDYRGGASTRTGTRYVLTAKTSSKPIRLIPFTASFTANFALEFGDFYIRFYQNGGPVLETAKNITGATQANPVVITSNAHGFNLGDWVYITGVAGMTQLNGRYFIISTVVTANTFGLSDLFGNTVNGTAYGAYTSGGTVQRVYTLPSPYAAGDLASLKFAQNINVMVLCHPTYVPYVLTFTSATNWTISPIAFGSNIAAPTGLGVATTGAGIMNYSYVLTSVDVNGQESPVSAVASSTVTNAAGNQAITITWTGATGAVSYNLYRAGPAANSAVPTGSSFGFVTNVTGLSHVDTFTAGIPVLPADYSDNIPIPKNPFQGAGVASATVTAAGTYTSVPTVTFAAAPAGGVTAQGTAVLKVLGTPLINNSDGINVVGDTLIGPNGVVLVVATVNGSGDILTFNPVNTPGSSPGALASGAAPGVGTGFTNARTGQVSTVDLTWGLSAVTITNHGAGYTSAPAITFSGGGGGAATAVLESTAAGNPTVPIFWNQRLVLGAKPATPQTFNGSQPRSVYNFNISDPIQPDDAFEGTLVATKLNTIQHFIVMSAGLIALADQQAWLINGGSPGAPATAIDLAANSQAYNGASGIPPIVANLDILYVQAKGYTVRSLTFNFYTNIYTGTDISVLSSHLFYGFSVSEWAYAEEPFKVIWAVRNDGILLSLTYLKEQELIGWAHSDTDGDFKSVCSITEQVTTWNGNATKVDAIYVVVERTINGQTVKYIERMAERLFQYGVEDAWCVDAGIQSAPAASNAASLSSGITLTLSTLSLGAATLTASSSLWGAPSVGQIVRMAGGIMTINSVPSGLIANVTITQAPSRLVNGPGTWSIWSVASSFSGGDHLVGETCTGLADGAVIPAFVMPSNGIFTLSAPASKVVVGQAFTPQLGTLQLDLGQPTVQGKRKKITGVALRCKDTLGLSIGKTLDSSSQVPMKDLVVGNLGSQTDEVVTNLMVTGDAFTNIDPSWDVPGQYFITQPNPLPASILGVIPDVVVGDS